MKYSDLDNQRGSLSLFPLIRKPDFQRETSAWTPEQCVSLLESIVNQLIIPSLIMWESPDNGLLYILDGGHRVSVVRAWILDDWGDHATEGYYERNEFVDEIKPTAKYVRELVKSRIGEYHDYITAGNKYLEIAGSGGSPKENLSTVEFQRGLFYTSLLKGAGFQIQRVEGNYEVAESSFVRINRGGQPLEDWEITLIENRSSSLARAVMSVANGGAGRFWPEDGQSSFSSVQINEIKSNSERLHHQLFVPPFETPIKDLNQPFMVSTPYFPKHAYLLELFPIIQGTGDVERLFSRDRDADAETIIRNGKELLARASKVFDHLTGPSSDPLSLSIVPLFYFYTKAGRYVRSSLYGFISWLMSGGEDEIRTRKIIFAAHRGRYEQVIFDHDMPGALTRRIGSGPRATPGTAKFNQQLLELLVSDSSEVTSESFQAKLKVIQDKLTVPRSGKTAKEGRNFDDTQKTTINIREIFKAATRCEICGGILNLKTGTQYDHVTRFADSGVTDVAQGRPTHPFCNNMRDAIEGYKSGTQKLKLPPIAWNQFIAEGEVVQLPLFTLFDDTSFPDE
ncbi:MAG TPA: HNH endonuclease signature motif containing protein [Anaerolineae bacterium]|nr:HNH endonuclease signature motif containing protein [Anaerolineae bacterium]